MFKGAPRKFVALMAVVVCIRLLGALGGRMPIAVAMVQVGFMLFFSWKALEGKESAAKGIAILLAIGAVLDCLSLLPLVLGDAPWAAILLIFPAFHVFVAAYIFRSRELHAFFAAATRRSYAEGA